MTRSRPGAQPNAGAHTITERMQAPVPPSRSPSGRTLAFAIGAVAAIIVIAGLTLSPTDSPSAVAAPAEQAATPSCPSPTPLAFPSPTHTVPPGTVPPTSVPTATAVPTAYPAQVTAVVGMGSGGVVSWGCMDVLVPPGAMAGQLQAVVAISAATVLPAAPPPGWIVGSTKFTITASGGTPQPAASTATVVPFAQSLVAYVPFSTADLISAYGDVSRISVQYYDPNGGQWVTPQLYPDLVNNQIVTQLTQPGTFAVLIRDPLFVAPPFGVSLNPVTPVPTPSPTPKQTPGTATPTSQATQTPYIIYVIVTATPDLFGVAPVSSSSSGEDFTQINSSDLPDLPVSDAPADGTSLSDGSGDVIADDLAGSDSIQAVDLELIGDNLTAVEPRTALGA